MEAPAIWFWLSGIFFVCGTVMFIVLAVVSIKLAQEIGKVSVKVSELTTKVNEIAVKVDSMSVSANQALSNVKTLTGTAQSHVTGILEAVHGISLDVRAHTRAARGVADTVKRLTIPVKALRSKDAAKPELAELVFPVLGVLLGVLERRMKSRSAGRPLTPKE